MIIAAAPLTDLLTRILEGAGAERDRARVCAELFLNGCRVDGRSGSR